jgi:hypothetical protein
MILDDCDNGYDAGGPDPTEIERVMRPAILVPRLVTLAAVLTASACAHRAGREATTGFEKELVAGQAAVAESPTQQISRVAGERAAAGAVEGIHDPEQREKLRVVVNELVAEAVATAFRTATEVPGGAEGEAGRRGVSPVALLMAQAARTAAEDALHELITGLGGKGQGPLGVSLAGTGRELSASVMGGALDRLGAAFPGCEGPDMFGCIDRRINQASRSAAAGFSSGLRDTLGWPLLILAALIGLGVGLLGHWLWTSRSNGRGRARRPRTT